MGHISKIDLTSEAVLIFDVDLTFGATFSFFVVCFANWNGRPPSKSTEHLIDKAQHPSKEGQMPTWNVKKKGMITLETNKRDDKKGRSLANLALGSKWNLFIKLNSGGVKNLHFKSTVKHKAHD